MHESVQKRLQEVFLAMEENLREFGNIRHEIENFLSNSVEGWTRMQQYDKNRMISEIMIKIMNEIGIHYTDNPKIWIGIEDVLFHDLSQKIKNLLSLIAIYNKDHHPIME